MFAAEGHLFTSPNVALDRTHALLRATELLGNWANAQNAWTYREDLLLSLSAPLAKRAHEQRTLCIHLVVRNSVCFLRTSKRFLSQGALTMEGESKKCFPNSKG